MTNHHTEYPFTTAYDLGVTPHLTRASRRFASVIESGHATVIPPLPGESTPRIRLHTGEADARIILDFGEEVIGHLRARLAGPAPVELHLHYGETLEEARITTPFPADWYKGPADVWPLTAGTRDAVSNGRRAFRYVHILAPAAPGDVEILDLELQEVGYPVVPRGQFACSSDRLNKIWDIACRTTRLCMQDFYEDGIKRDGLLWVGDFRIQYLCNAGAFGDRDLARRSLLMIAASQRHDGALPACCSRGGGHQHPHNINYMGNIPFSGADSWVLTNYGADFPANVRDYVLHTGDRALLTTLQSCLERLLNWLMTECSVTDERSATAPFWSVKDPGYFTDNTVGLSSRTGLCAQLFDGFHAMEQLGIWLDDAGMTKRSRTGREFIAAQFRRYLLNPSDGSLADQATRDERVITSSWHAPAFAAFAGLLNDDAGRTELLRAMQTQDSLKTASGYCEFLLVDALFSLGLHEAAITEMERYWGTMLDAGLTTCPEATDGTQAFYGNLAKRSAPLSYCHGWSGGPAYLLPAHVLGVRPTAPGYQTISIEPKLGGLQWAKGRHPTPLGDIDLEYERTPKGIQGQITLPEGARATLHTGDAGQPVISLKRGRNSIRFT